jgi:UDP-N-acetyl-D-mannosaminuronic acid transferase (WecB/TagA/CpsF family)
MATPARIQLSPKHHPAFYTSGMNDEVAKKASELLQENHDKHHIFFRASGFHVMLKSIIQAT